MHILQKKPKKNQKNKIKLENCIMSAKRQTAKGQN